MLDGFITTLLLCCLMSLAQAEENEVVDFNIPRQGIESALGTLAGSTGKLLLFPYENIELEKSNPVVGKRILNNTLSII